jgi:hypothetical protein
MKKIYSKLIIFVFVFCLVVIKAHGQIGLSIGAKGGVSLPYSSGTDANVAYKIGWSTGLFSIVTVGKFFAIQPELLIQEKGISCELTGSKREVRLNYFQIPLLFKLRFPIKKMLYPTVFAGPNFSYRVDASYPLNNNHTYGKKDLVVNKIQNYETVGTFGLGLDYEVDRIFLTIDARYGFGFNQLKDQSICMSFRNKDLSFLAGVGFKLGRKKILH